MDVWYGGCMVWDFDTIPRYHTRLYSMQLMFHQWRNTVKSSALNKNWAAALQNKQNDLCAQQRLRSTWASTQSDQSSLSAWTNIGPLTTYWVHSKDWSDWVDAQADLSLHWAHMLFYWFCCAAAQIWKIQTPEECCVTVLKFEHYMFTIDREIHPKDVVGMADNVDPDLQEQSDQGLHCLLSHRPVCLKTG